MSFSAISQQLFGQRPIYLYEFIRSGISSRYSNQADDVTYLGEPWAASEIAHSSITHTSNVQGQDVKITFSLSNTFARQFLAPVDAIKTFLVIRKLHATDPDTEIVVKFRGRLISVTSNRRNIVLTFEGGLTEQNINGLSNVIQRPCRHALYHGGCGLSLNTFQTSGTISAIDTNTNTLTVAEAASQSDNYFRGGILSYGGVLRMIESHSSDQLFVRTFPQGLVDDFTTNGSVAILLAPGCDLTAQTCQDRFNNLLNYGGFNYISDTPFDGQSLV